MPMTTIKIRPNGDVSIDNEGFDGKGCEKLGDRLLDALGVNPNDVQKNYHPEYYAQEHGTEQVGGA